jgi:ABC-type amino acid transport substrate-binding protein
MVIEASYMVRVDSPLKRFEDFDRKGIRIATNNNAAFDIWMQRNLKHAERVTATSSPEAVDMFLARRDLDAVAGVRTPLMAAAAKNPGYRVIDGSSPPSARPRRAATRSVGALPARVRRGEESLGFRRQGAQGSGHRRHRCACGFQLKLSLW